MIAVFDAMSVISVVVYLCLCWLLVLYNMFMIVIFCFLILILWNVHFVIYYKEKTASDQTCVSDCSVPFDYE